MLLRPLRLQLAIVAWMALSLVATGCSGGSDSCLSEQDCPDDNEFCDPDFFTLTGDCERTCGSEVTVGHGTHGAPCRLDSDCTSGDCANDVASAACTCVGAGTGGSGGTRTIVDRCRESTEVYCNNGYDCRDMGWSVSAQAFADFYGGTVSECLASGTPCTTEEVYCPDRGFPGTYNAANHEACIAGQMATNCAVDELNLPAFPAECDEICVE